MRKNDSAKTKVGGKKNGHYVAQTVLLILLLRMLCQNSKIHIYNIVHLIFSPKSGDKKHTRNQSPFAVAYTRTPAELHPHAPILVSVCSAPSSSTHALGAQALAPLRTPALPADCLPPSNDTGRVNGGDP